MNGDSLIVADHRVPPTSGTGKPWLPEEAQKQLALLAQKKFQQDEVERHRKREEEERKKRREDMRRKKKMLEAAFDGQIEDIQSFLDDVKEKDECLPDDEMGDILRRYHVHELVNCEDSNGNTPLSEAAGGGQAEAVRLLILRGGLPNHRGHFNRTPLYRASFAGHADAVKALLQAGADPTIYADDGQTPRQVASNDAVREVYENWDMEITENLLEKQDEMKAVRLEEDKKRREFEIKQLEEQTRAAEREADKRLREAESNRMSGYNQGYGGNGSDAWYGNRNAEVDKEMESQLPGLRVHIKELDEVLCKDMDNKIEESGKWPLLIDPSQQAATFLRYRDNNYINALSSRTMQAERIRMAIVGALRFGKGVVLDMMGSNMLDQCAIQFDTIEDGLWKSVMDKSIMNAEKFTPLLREYDGEDYQMKKFNKMRVRNFRFYIITQNLLPPDELLEKTYPIRVTTGETETSLQDGSEN